MFPVLHQSRRPEAGVPMTLGSVGFTTGDGRAHCCRDGNGEWSDAYLLRQGPETYHADMQRSSTDGVDESLSPLWESNHVSSRISVLVSRLDHAGSGQCRTCHGNRAQRHDLKFNIRPQIAIQFASEAVPDCYFVGASGRIADEPPGRPQLGKRELVMLFRRCWGRGWHRTGACAPFPGRFSAARRRRRGGQRSAWLRAAFPW